MAYAHPAAGERCTKCNDLATRVVGTQPLCIDHLTNLLESCRMNTRARILTPQDTTPDGFAAWAILLRHGINIGVITDDEAAAAWNAARDFAA